MSSRARFQINQNGEPEPRRLFSYSVAPADEGSGYGSTLDMPGAYFGVTVKNWRHSNGLNYLFYDGHVKFMTTQFRKTRVLAIPEQKATWCPYDPAVFNCDTGWGWD